MSAQNEKFWLYTEIDKRNGVLDLVVVGAANTWPNAVANVANLKYGLGLAHSPILLSWATGDATDFVHDEIQLPLAVPDVAVALVRILEHRNTKKVRLWCHSLGTKVCLWALWHIRQGMPGLERRAPLLRKIKLIVLAAGAIHHQVFLRWLPELRQDLEMPIIAYGTHKDRALALGEVITRRKYIGQSGEDLGVLQDFQWIDVTAVLPDGGLLERYHSWIYDNELVQTDASIMAGIASAARRLRPVDTSRPHIRTLAP